MRKLRAGTETFTPTQEWMRERVVRLTEPSATVNEKPQGNQEFSGQSIVAGDWLKTGNILESTYKSESRNLPGGSSAIRQRI